VWESRAGVSGRGGESRLCMVIWDQRQPHLGSGRERFFSDTPPTLLRLRYD
jgi:hypothetical protein